MAGSLVIWDQTYRKYFLGMEVEWLDSYSEFQKKDVADFRVYNRIFLLAELDWDVPRAATDYPGFDLLVRLRRMRLQCPIVICSIHPKSYYISLSTVPFGLLRLPHAHPFVQLPVLIDDLNLGHSSRPISDLQLQDAINHFTNPLGMVEEQLHHLKNYLGPQGIGLVSEVFQQIAGVILQGNLKKLGKLEEALLEELENGAENYQELVNNYKSRIEDLLPRSLPNTEHKHPIPPWRVLYIDDQKKTREQLRDLLASKYHIKCLVAATGEEAIQILKNDMLSAEERANAKSTWIPNSITTVICDLRFETKQQDWFEMQGYDIIKHIHEHLPNQLSLVVLSNKRNDLKDLHLSLGGIRWRGFTKDSVITPEGTGFQVFAEHLIQEGNEVAESIEMTPTASNWHTAWEGKINAPLRKYYRAHRMNREYLIAEKRIEKEADDFIEEAEMIRSSLFPNKNKLDAATYKKGWKAGITDSEPTPKAMQKFYVKLIGRRIAIGLHLRGWDVDDISNLMKKGHLSNESADRQMFSSYLCLSTKISKDVPDNLLVEEKNWLAATVGYSHSSRERRFFAALGEILSVAQDDLRSSGCPDDFTDLEIRIGNSKAAVTLHQTCTRLTKKYLPGKTKYTEQIRAVIDYSENRKAVTENQSLRQAFMTFL